MKCFVNTDNAELDQWIPVADKSVVKSNRMENSSNANDSPIKVLGNQIPGRSETEYAQPMSSQTKKNKCRVFSYGFSLPKFGKYQLQPNRAI